MDVVKTLAEYKQMLESQEREALKELQRIQQELVKAKKALQAIAEPKRPRGTKKVTIDEKILDILENKPEGMTSLQMNEIIGVASLNSLSVRLSNLKKAGMIRRNGFIWQK